jgi:hypothetical protein
MAFHCEIAIADSGGLGHTDIAELNQSLRRNINSARGYRPHNRAGHRAPRHRVRQTSAATTTAASIFGLTRRAWVAAARSEQADEIA